MKYGMDVPIYSISDHLLFPRQQLVGKNISCIRYIHLPLIKCGSHIIVGFTQYKRDDVYIQCIR